MCVCVCVCVCVGVCVVCAGLEIGGVASQAYCESLLGDLRYYESLLGDLWHCESLLGDLRYCESLLSETIGGFDWSRVRMGSKFFALIGLRPGLFSINISHYDQLSIMVSYYYNYY